MRILFISAMLAVTAACAVPLQPQAVAPAAVAAAPAPTPLFIVSPTPPSAPVAAVAAVPAGAPPPAVYIGSPVPVDVRPTWLVWPLLFNEPAPAGRFTLSNFDFDGIRVQTALTAAADCAAADPRSIAEFYMPLNATRVIVPPRGQDVCWRRQAHPRAEGPASAPAAGWTAWDRAFTASGRFIDSQL